MQPSNTCPYCDTSNPTTAISCASCGQKRPPEPIVTGVVPDQTNAKATARTYEPAEKASFVAPVTAT